MFLTGTLYSERNYNIYLFGEIKIMINYHLCDNKRIALVGISNALNCSIDYFLMDEYKDTAIPADNEIIKKIK